jgi:type I restriction enzyme M protein
VSDGLAIEETDQMDDIASLDDGMLLDYITGEPVKETPKEQVRQRIARALLHEYGISVEDMVPDYRLRVEGKLKKIDIAIFAPGTGIDRRLTDLRRVVMCDKEPKIGTKGAYHMRDHEQAKKDFGPLFDVLREVEECRHGLWTNGLDFFFFEKEITRFDVKFQPRGDWPLGDDTVGSRTVASNAYLRPADRDMLLTAFRRCHNYIHGNEGMPKDAAFWQFLYLIFAKMHDERRRPEEPPRFWAGLTHRTVNGKQQIVDEQFDPQGQQAIRTRVEELFAEAREEYQETIFTGNERITLSDRALAFMVAELAKYDFGRTPLDFKGAAYQQLVGTNLRGDRGQYFTPRDAIDLMVSILNPQEKERVLDPACGTGGFLVATLNHLSHQIHEDMGVEIGNESPAELLAIKNRLARYARTNIFGADFDQFLVRASQMNVVMAGNTDAQLFNMNSLEFPAGHLPGLANARGLTPLGSMRVVMTNPPFGSDIPVADPNILRHYELAHVWERTEDGGFRNTGRLQGKVAPEILFIERCYQWLEDNGRMGIVLPDGVLGNPGDEYIRWWLLRHCWVLASIDMPVELFIVEANVNILTSLLFLKKKPDHVVRTEDLSTVEDYPVFMAVADKVGFDRRGNPLYKRGPDGEDLLDEVEHKERVRIGGRSVVRVLRRKEKTSDNDLPEIAAAYAAFRADNPEPGK